MIRGPGLEVRRRCGFTSWPDVPVAGTRASGLPAPFFRSRTIGVKGRENMTRNQRKVKRRAVWLRIVFCLGVLAGCGAILICKR